MSRFRCLIAVLLASSMLTSTASGQDKIEWRLTQVVGETSNFYTLFTDPFVEDVDLLTDGKVVIKPSPAGVIAPAFEAYDAVQDGLADAGQSTPLYIVNDHPANSFFAGHPGGMPPEPFIHWLYEGGGQELLQEFRRDRMGLHSLIVGMGPAEIWHSHKKIRTVDDLEGVKFRTAGAWAQILEEYFDAAPTTVPGSEVYTMLERQAIDALEWSTPAENVKKGLHEAAPYVITPGAHLNAFAFEVFVKTETWDALDKKTQMELEAAAKLTTIDSLLQWRMQDIEAMQELRAGGVEIIELDSSAVDAIREAGRDWANKRAEKLESEGDDWMRKIGNSYYDFYESWLENSTFHASE